MEKISVIIPVYNVEKYLDKCIKSVVEQEYKNLEIIIVNDGSTDSSFNICEKWRKSDKRIRIINKTNGGLSDSRNIGIKKATGKYLGFVDSDDYISKYMYIKLYENLVNNNADVSVCGSWEQDENGEFNNLSYVEEHVFNKDEGLKELFGNDKLQHTAWNKLYKKELFEDIEFPVGKVYEDLSIMYKIFRKCNKISSIPESYYYHIYRENGISRLWTLKSATDYYNACNDVMKAFENTSLEKVCEKRMLEIEMEIWINLVKRKTKDCVALTKSIRSVLIKKWKYVFIVDGMFKIKMLVIMFFSKIYKKFQ